MSQLIYNKDKTQVYLIELDNEIIIDINEHCMHNDVDSRICLLYTSPSPRDRTRSRMPSSA